MAKINYSTIDAYHSAFPAEVQERMQQIRQVIKAVVPDAEEVISYSIPAFKYKGYLIYYSAYARHISLSSPWSEAFLKTFEPEIKKLKLNVSKSAIQFPAKDVLPLALIKRMVAFRKKENDKKQ